jgi:flagellar basal body-associated protein FliL
MLWILLFLIVVILTVVGVVLVYANNKDRIDKGVDKARKVKDIIEGE